MTKKAWDASWTMNEETARELLTRQFPEFTNASVKRLGEGWDNLALCVNNSHIFRFPKSELAVQRLHLECKLLPALSEALPVLVPYPKWQFEGSEDNPPFLGYPMLTGETACKLNLNTQARAKLAADLGHFLKCLHNLDTEQAPFFYAPPDLRNRLNPDVRLPLMESYVTKATELGILKAPDIYLRALKDAAEKGKPAGPTKLSLVHGDFYARHLLLDESNELTGIIDWGDMHLADPAEDLEIVHSFLPKEAQEAFFATYGEIDQATWHRSRFRALYHALMMAVYAHDRNDIHLMREQSFALSNLLPHGTNVALPSDN